jgi:hypothetical protein
VPLVLRNMPINFDNIKLNRLLNGIEYRSEEEPILLNDKKHTIILFYDIETAVEAMQTLTVRMREQSIYFKVNLHPEFTKSKWRSLDMKVNPYASFFRDKSINGGEADE